MRDSLRLFVAVDMPDAVTQEITKIQNHLQPLNLFQGTFANPDDTHVTLKFLGDVQERNIDAVRERLRAVKLSSMKAILDTMVVFPSPQRVQVIVQSLLSDGLIDLAQKVEAALGDLAQPDGRVFKPHATIARVKYIADDDRQKLLAELGKITIERVSFKINEFVLKRSRLGDAGPEHYVLERYKLMP